MKLPFYLFVGTYCCKNNAEPIPLPATVNNRSRSLDPRRSQLLFDKILGSELPGRSSTGRLSQILQFYLATGGKDQSLAHTLLKYGCWCQIRTSDAFVTIPGKLSRVFSVSKFISKVTVLLLILSISCVVSGINVAHAQRLIINHVIKVPADLTRPVSIHFSVV